MAVRLVMKHDGGAYALDLSDGQFVIGRDPGATIVINDDSVSGRHAELTVTGSLAKIRDLGSSNGTWVNGFRLNDHNPRIVSEVDRLRIGAIELAIELVGADAAQKPAYVGQVVSEQSDEGPSAIPGLLTFRGRLGIFEYWIVLFLMVPAFIIMARTLGWTTRAAIEAHQIPPMSTAEALALGLLGIVVVWFILCATAKRWHDRNKSAWWLLLAIIPLALQITFIVRFGVKSTPSVLAAALTALSLTWNLVELGMMSGTIGHNRYGG